MTVVAKPEVSVEPHSLKDAPALIERLLPVQKLSAEVYKERMSSHGQTLVSLGGYWKGRKPLILNKACILGSLLPATDNPARDLEIFEKLMAMDDESFVIRWPRRPKPSEILAVLPLSRISDYFVVEPKGALPVDSPIDWSREEFANVKVSWRDDLSDIERIQLEVQTLPKTTYRDRVDQSKRPEQVMDTVHNHIWSAVNDHLGTNAHSFSQLVEQLGIMRFGHRPRVGDNFCGSGQIPFEAARLGCDVFAADLNPVACMLTWGALNMVGGSKENRAHVAKTQRELADKVQAEFARLGVETDGKGWKAKVFLYCVETRCPQTGWMVPLLPSRIVSTSYKAIAELVPDEANKRYLIKILMGVSDSEMKSAESGTVGREGKYGEAYLIHRLNGVEYKTMLTTLRGDIKKPDGSISNRLRQWDKLDFTPAPDDLLQERLYCIQWMRPKTKGSGEEYEFRTVTEDDLRRESMVQEYVAKNLGEWQKKGFVPDMRIEVGGPPRYQGLDLIRARGWTYWHHLFNPRQLLMAGIVNQFSDAQLKFGLTQLLNNCARLSRWRPHAGGGGGSAGVYDNQALNTLFNYACRSSLSATNLLTEQHKNFPFEESVVKEVKCISAEQNVFECDLFITDPPYGDAVKYEEILDFFIAWLRKNPPAEFSEWVWDSRRALAIKGEDEDFRRSMVAAYKRMTECMPENGLQVVMFTHQDGAIWADMANIVWASGLQVTAAWYVVTETDSALREGSNVKGTVLLIARKRQGLLKTTRDDLAWEIKEEVESQVNSLTGLNQSAKGLYRDENVFEDADLQMAGYAAALRTLTRYAIIDGRDMVAEAIRPRVKGQTTFVDGLIDFAVDTANQCLVPQGIPKSYWDKLTGAERFYIKMLDMESRGVKSLDNYQNFAKAFKVRDFKSLLQSHKANQTRLKSATDFGRAEMSEGSELYQSVLRAVLYALMEVQKNLDGSEVLAHLSLNIPNYYGDMTQRQLAVELADYLARRLDELRPDEASAARVLGELIRNQRLG